MNPQPIKKLKRSMSKRFALSLLVVSLVYVLWTLLFYFSSEQQRGSDDQATQPANSQTANNPMPYEDLAAAYAQLQQQLQKVDSTHLIRRYHGRHALFSAEHVFDEKVMAASRGYFQSQLGRERIYLDLPDFDWQRDDTARAVDTLRLTFRGNGIPSNVEQLARSGLLDPKLHAFYTALIQENTVLWTRPDASVSFLARTAQGELYQAQSTPFISVQRLSKDYFAKMQAASLPFLWKAYVDEELQKTSQRELLNEPYGPADSVGPYSPDYAPRKAKGAQAEVKGPHLPRTQAETLASDDAIHSADEPYGPFVSTEQQSLLDALPELAEALAGQQAQPAVSSFNMDGRKVGQLFEHRFADQSGSFTESMEWRKAINSKRQQAGLPALNDKHLDRLSRLDPEFITLFLINNLFEQYNIFTVFDKDVYLTINALDTRMNVMYVSYNLRFDPVQLREGEQVESRAKGCGEGKPVQISDEFFLIAAQPYSYLIRAYLPSCELTEGDFAQIDAFLSEMRILH